VSHDAHIGTRVVSRMVDEPRSRNPCTADAVDVDCAVDNVDTRRLVAFGEKKVLRNLNIVIIITIFEREHARTHTHI